jgi:PAS domain S-box-containing protein
MALTNAFAAEEFVQEQIPGQLHVKILQTVKPYIAVAAVVVTGTVLVAAIYFTALDLQWITFLGGVLFASILAMTTRAAHTEIASASRGEGLALAKYQLARETEHRKELEKKLGKAIARLHYSDELLPVMLAFVDTNTHYLYHNRAFANWLGLDDTKIDGQHMRDVLGRRVFAEIESYVFEAAAGRSVRYERTQKSPKGAIYRFAVQYLPQFAGDGTYTGFYKTITDITERRDVRSPPRSGSPGEAEGMPGVGPGSAGMTGSPAHRGDAPPGDALAELEDTWHYASQRILAAINGNEFTLFCQRIAPLSGNNADAVHYEVLIRLLEEENSMVPPGSFFALAEEHGLLPQLDRWVFTHVLDWMVTSAGAGTVRAGTIYFINIATATISDPDFADFVEHELRRTGVPGRSVCVEIAENDLALHSGDAMAFAHSMRECGCLTAISGFGRNRVPMDTLMLLSVNFLKIDGSIVRQILTYPAYLGRAVSICRCAQNIDVRTIAEMVEDQATLEILGKMKVDFAQGLGVAVPKRLIEIS